MYQAEQMLDALREMVLKADFEDKDIHTLYEKLQKHITPFVEALQVSRIEVHIESGPTAYDLNGHGETLSTDFSENVGDEPLELTYADLFMTTATVKVYPRAAYTWSEQETQLISTVSKLAALHFSRANMVHRIERLSYIDLLTGLANSSGVAYYGSQIAQNYSLSEFAGCSVNIKNFKYLMQQLNSSSSDALVRQYALRLYGVIDHRCELAARLGGDSFFVLIRKDRLERFIKFVSSLIIILSEEGKRTRLTVDSWVGVYPGEEGDSISDILANAIFANEQAKSSHNSVAYFEAAAKEAHLHSKEIAHTLPEAMRRRELVAYYQPKVDASSGELYGCEALVRWIRNGKVVPPSDFVPIAEASGLITTLDLYMLDVVCQDLRSWLDRGVDPVCVSVNYSQNDFNSPTLIEDTIAVLRKYCIDGKYIEIEITESSFFESFTELEIFIDAMHKNGIRVSLDDFGTGYSSLNMLKSLDLDTVKLDKSFFSNVSGSDEKSRIVLQSVADMIGRLSKTAISEGVEDADQIDLARQIGCNIVQGFFFDKPLSCDEFTQRLHTRRYEL